MGLLIVYEGTGRGSRRAADALAEAASAAGGEAMVALVTDVTPDDVDGAGALLVGCNVNVRVPFGGERTRRMTTWISELPPLAGKPTAVFCTYAFFPVLFADAVARTAETLNQMSMGLEAKGANVVATHAFHRRSPSDGAADVVSKVLQHADG